MSLQLETGVLASGLVSPCAHHGEEKGLQSSEEGSEK